MTGVCIVNTQTNQIVSVKNRSIFTNGGSGMLNSLYTTDAWRKARIHYIATKLQIGEPLAEEMYTYAHARGSYNKNYADGYARNEKIIEENRELIEYAQRALRFQDQTLYVKKKVVGVVFED